MVKKETLVIGDFPLVLSLCEGTFRCDECKESFKGKEIELNLHDDRISMINPMLSFKFFQAPDHFIGTSNTTILDKDKKYYTLHCPKCHQVHLFGMDAAKT